MSLLTFLCDNAYTHRVVLADGCASITHDFSTLYTQYTYIYVYIYAIGAICWTHAAKAIDRKQKSVPLEQRRVLRSDVSVVQLSTD